MLSKLTKNSWMWFTENLGKTIVHPQWQLLRFQQESIQEAKKHAKGKLVDIGCGRMPYRSQFEPLVESYTGVDHPEVSKLYNSNIKPDVLADAKKLPFERGEFDIALMLQVLEHVDSPGLVLKETARVLKPNGILVITIPFLYPLHDMPHDWGRYTSSALKGLLESSGFQVTKTIEQGGFFEFWLQMLNTFLAKRTYDMIKTRVGLHTILLPFVVFLAIPTILLSNIFIFLVGVVSVVLPKYPNYFPLQYVVVAKRKAK